MTKPIRPLNTLDDVPAKAHELAIIALMLREGCGGSDIVQALQPRTPGDTLKMLDLLFASDRVEFHDDFEGGGTFRALIVLGPRAQIAPRYRTGFELDGRPCGPVDLIREANSALCALGFLPIPYPQNGRVAA